MKHAVLAIGIWLIAVDASLAQSSRLPAEECDCTGTCRLPPAAGGGLEIAKAGTFDLPAADFQNALNLVVPLKNGAALPPLGDKILRFDSMSKSASPQLLDVRGRLVGEIDQDLLQERISLSSAIDKMSSRVLALADPKRVTDPILKKGDFPLPTSPKGLALCRAAVQASNSPLTRTCADAVANLCPRGTDASSCNLVALQEKVARGDATTVGALVRYDKACLRSDTPGAGASKFNFQTITSRSGVLKINADKASDSCGIVARAIPSADKVFCSAVAIEPGKILTARHCFVGSQNIWSDVSTCIGQGAIEFSTLSDPAKSHVVANVQGPAEALGRIKPDDDYIVLELQAPIAGLSGAVKHAKPAPLEEAAVFSYHDLVSPADPANAPAWRRKARWSLPTCTFTQVSDGCALTKCQTIEMYSGAPVWMLDEAGITSLGGIQTQGGGGSFRNCKAASPLSTLSGFDTNLSIRGYAQ